MELHEITTEPNSVNLTLTGVTLLGIWIVIGQLRRSRLRGE